MGIERIFHPSSSHSCLVRSDRGGLGDEIKGHSLTPDRRIIAMPCLVLGVSGSYGDLDNFEPILHTEPASTATTFFSFEG